MKALIGVITAIGDLLRAELRHARSEVHELWGTMLLSTAACTFLLLGGGLVLAAIFMGVLRVAPPVIAALVTGLIALVVGAALVWAARLKSRR